MLKKNKFRKNFFFKIQNFLVLTFGRKNNKIFRWKTATQRTDSKSDYIPRQQKIQGKSKKFCVGETTRGFGRPIILLVRAQEVRNENRSNLFLENLWVMHQRLSISLGPSVHLPVGRAPSPSSSIWGAPDHSVMLGLGFAHIRVWHFAVWNSVLKNPRPSVTLWCWAP